MVQYKEPSWTWEESPAEYFQTLESAEAFFQSAVNMNGRFRVIALFDPSGVLLREIDLGPRHERP